MELNLGGHEIYPVGVSMNNITRELESACISICSLIQFFEACTVIKLSSSDGGDDDICRLLKKIYDQLQNGDVSGLANNAEKLRGCIVKAQGVISDRITVLENLSDSARKARNASLIASVVSAAAFYSNPNIFTFACLIVSFGVFVTSTASLSLIKYQLTFFNEARDKITNLQNQLIMARSSSYRWDPSKSAVFADAIKTLGIAIKCTCF
ncbi:hypothetical protein RclHR1_08840001 [Rhizophagus clarus]|uniref:Uncharacterized protein n=1 Tax=Rhizophagus clarus TaxID=94130 RepID=A0A2Z6SH35_9GLOM|nr:hypothetical protein RclHR1_08840001 [Rhizophagus clarus]GES73374.1 hypothetical protein GLOIN_2v1779628 [Rhizophagus clarus]